MLLIFFFNVTEPSDFIHSMHHGSLFFPSPQSCGCSRFWCFTYPSHTPRVTILSLPGYSHVVCIKSLPSVQVKSLLYLLFHCPHLIEFHCHCSTPTIKKLTFPLEAISSESPCISLDRLQREFESISIQFPKPRQVLFASASTKVYMGPSRHILSTAHWSTNSLPSPNHITALNSIIHSLSYSEVLSRTDLSSLQRLLKSLARSIDHGSTMWAIVGFLDWKLSTSESQVKMRAHPYSRPCTPAYDQGEEDDETSTIQALGQYWKIWFGRALSILKRTPSRPWWWSLYELHPTVFAVIEHSLLSLHLLATWLVYTFRTQRPWSSFLPQSHMTLFPTVVILNHLFIKDFGKNRRGNDQKNSRSLLYLFQIVDEKVGLWHGLISAVLPQRSSAEIFLAVGSASLGTFCRSMLLIFHSIIKGPTWCAPHSRSLTSLCTRGRKAPLTLLVCVWCLKSKIRFR